MIDWDKPLRIAELGWEASLLRKIRSSEYPYVVAVFDGQYEWVCHFNEEGKQEEVDYRLENAPEVVVKFVLNISHDGEDFDSFRTPEGAARNVDEHVTHVLRVKSVEGKLVADLVEVDRQTDS